MTVPAPPSSPPRLPALDSIRGLAALAVVINHLFDLSMAVGDPPAGYTAAPLAPALERLLASPLAILWNGPGAVALFFVLSGFVLSIPWHHQQAPSYRVFAIRRLCRIYLPYAAAVALSMILAAALFDLRPPGISRWFQDENWTTRPDLAAVADHLLMLGHHNWFDNPVWSLNHEMRISLLFPLLVWPLIRFGWPAAALGTIALYGAAGVITRTFGWDYPSAEIAASVRFAAFFVLGAWLGAVAPRIAACPARWRTPAAWAALLVGLLTLWAWREPATRAIGSALVITAALIPGAIQSTLLRAPLRTLGRISYSLYLVHLPLILTLVCLLTPTIPLPLIALAGLALALPAAALFHRAVEAPAQRLGRHLT